LLKCILNTIGKHSDSAEAIHNIGKSYSKVICAKFSSYFIDTASTLEYVKYLEKSLGISSLEDWKNIGKASLKGVKLPPQWK
jgi:hypothetical protein